MLDTGVQVLGDGDVPAQARLVDHALRDVPQGPAACLDLRCENVLTSAELGTQAAREGRDCLRRQQLDLLRQPLHGSIRIRIPVPHGPQLGPSRRQFGQRLGEAGRPLHGPDGP